MKNGLRKSVFVVLCFAMIGCGKNVYRQFETEDAAKDAAHEMEDDKPEEAISILEAALESDSENWVLVSLLSAAYAQKHEVSLVDLALSFASGGDDDDTNDNANGLTALWPYLPDATDDNLTGVDYSLTLLQSIPSDDRTDADYFKMAILSVATVSLSLKSLDTNGDGNLSTQELLSLSATTALAVLNGLSAAVSALSSIDGDLGDSSEDAAADISAVYSDVQSSDGDSDEEKVASYMSDNQD